MACKAQSIPKHGRGFMQMSLCLCVCACACACACSCACACACACVYNSLHEFSIELQLLSVFELVDTLSRHVEKKKKKVFQSLSRCNGRRCFLHGDRAARGLPRSCDSVKSLNIIYHVCQTRPGMIIEGDLNLRTLQFAGHWFSQRGECFCLSTEGGRVCARVRERREHERVWECNGGTLLGPVPSFLSLDLEGLGHLSHFYLSLSLKLFHLFHFTFLPLTCSPLADESLFLISLIAFPFPPNPFSFYFLLSHNPFLYCAGSKV